MAGESKHQQYDSSGDRDRPLSFHWSAPDLARELGLTSGAQRGVRGCSSVDLGRGRYRCVDGKGGHLQPTPRKPGRSKRRHC